MELKKYEIIEDGTKYTVLKDNSGNVIAKCANEPSDTIEQPRPQPLSEQEQIAIDTALTVEYMACLMEASLA